MMFLLLMYYLHDVRNANFVLSIWILVNIRAEKAQCYVLAKACLKKFESEKNSIDTAGTKRLIFETQIPQICQASKNPSKTGLNRDWEKPFMGDRQNKQNNSILSSINN